MENFFKVEKLYKKYKALIYGTLTVTVLGVASYYSLSYIQNQDKITANNAYNKLLKNPNDTVALAILKETNSKLYEIVQYSKDNSSKTEVEFLKELSLYSQAMKENSVDKIVDVTTSQSFLLKDFALVNKAIIETQEKKYLNAKETLKMIPESSTVSPLVLMLEHFLLTK